MVKTFHILLISAVLLSKLARAGVHEGRFRYMQALDAYYPDDRATGFQAGDVRGVISLVAPAR